MRPAHSYQSPSMTPPDEPDYELVEEGLRGSRCHVPIDAYPHEEACFDRAIVQDDIDAHLCVEHYEEAMNQRAADDRAERQVESRDTNNRWW